MFNQNAIFIVGLFSFICLYNNSVNCWLHDCNLLDCEKSLQKCIDINCVGEKQCLDCVKSSNYKCELCIKKVLNPFEYENMDGDIFLACDSTDSLQVAVCSIYCRANGGRKGSCNRISSKKVFCQCQ
jgi:hypothetical protein